jgi:glucose-6-phosphate 1-dehydrogenase
LFIRFDEVEAAWDVVDPVLRHWQETTDDLHPYAAGTWGPDAEQFFDKPHHQWRNDP